MRFPHRLSIAGLMAIVLVCSLGLVALRSQSATWAGGVYLLTYAVLLLAIVGVVCRPASERAGWLGFALFGIAYFRPSWLFGFRKIHLPTTLLLDLIRPPGAGSIDKFEEVQFGHFWLVGHCLWSLLAATFGGVVAHALFAAAKVRSTEPDPAPRPVSRPARVPWGRAVAIGLAVLAPLVAPILISPRSNPALWAGTVYLSTWVMLGTTVLGFACGRGKRRMNWLGAALFGLGFMTLNRSGDGFEEFSYVHLVTDEFLVALRPMLPEVLRGFPAQSGEMVQQNARIRKILDRQVPMRFREATPLEDVLNYIRATTKTVDGRELPIYVDTQALSDRDKTMRSTVQIDLEDCSLETTLRVALRQFDLVFYVTDGIVYITTNYEQNLINEVDYYLLVGHSLLATLAAGLGAILVPLVASRGA